MSQNENTKPSAAQSVLAEVADALKASPPVVRKRLVDKLVEDAVAKRASDLEKGLNKLKEMKKAMEKIRPADMFDADGNKVPGHFTKQQHEELKKAKEKYNKLESAMEKAFAGEGFDKLASLVAGKSDEDKLEDEDKSE